MSRTRRVVGLRLPYPVACFVSVAEEFAKRLEDRLADPRPSIEAEVAAITTDLAAQRGQDADRAVELGGRLICLKARHGPKDFGVILTRLHISERTARNKIALALFANRYPELYARFRTLGPTKLYRLAVLNPEEIRHLTLDTEIETSRGQVMVRQLTSSELETYLRQLVPPKARRSWIRRATQSLGRAIRALTRAATEANDAGDLQLFAGQLQEASGLLKKLGPPDPDSTLVS